MHEEQPQSLPWYRDTQNDHPFKLYKKITIDSPGHESEALRTLAPFPWNVDSLQTLWSGSLATEENHVKWRDVIAEFKDVVVVAGDTKVYIVWTMRKKQPLTLTIPDLPGIKLIHPDVTNVAWVLSQNAITEPLVVISRGSVLWIYNPIHRGISGYLRGHGGAITTIVVHPVLPNLFCTTSRDHTARIYDLTLTPHQGHREPNLNPHWPPGTLPSRAGAPHGLHMNEIEGVGIGRCVVVLQGGRSGGHQAAVLNACFHPHLPIIATCGVDRCIKIWSVHPRNSTQITREDKPLFSSSRIHRSRVLSVRWLSDDILISHGPSAIMFDDPNDLDEENTSTHLVPGELVVWRWLGLDRFFPPIYDKIIEEGHRQPVLVGCASDYQESASFTLLAAAAFPDLRLQLISPVVNIYQSPTHDPIALCVIPSGLPFFRHAPEQDQTGSGKNHTDSLLPPDEIDNPTPISAMPTAKGKATKVAGIITIVHVPSLPIAKPPKFPVQFDPAASLGLKPSQRPTSTNPTSDSSENGDGTESSNSEKLGLSGISEWHPALMETEPLPPITGWNLNVPLDDEDSVFEAAQPLREGEDRMHVDEGEANVNTGQAGSGTGTGTKGGEPIKVRVQTTAMAMDGRMIIALGTRGRIWIYKNKGC